MFILCYAYIRSINYCRNDGRGLKCTSNGHQGVLCARLNVLKLTAKKPVHGEKSFFALSIAQTIRQCTGIWALAFGYLISGLMRDFMPNVKLALFSTFVFISDNNKLKYNKLFIKTQF